MNFAGLRSACSFFARVFLTLAIFSSFCGVVGAGEFFSDFNSGLPSRTILLGSAEVGEMGGVDNSGVLKLTITKPHCLGSLVIEPLDGNMPVRAFTAEFKLYMYGGTSGDGVGFMFHSSFPNHAFTEQEKGKGLTVVFDSYRNRPDQVAPGIRVYNDKEEIAAVLVPGFRKRNFVDVVVKLDSTGQFEVNYDGRLVISNVVVKNFSLPGQFALAARTAVAFDNHFIDDLKIVTETVHPYVEWVEPSDDNASPRPIIRVGLKKLEKSIDQKPIVLRLDGRPIEHSVLVTSDHLVITGETEDVLIPGSTHEASITFAESGKKGPSSFAFKFKISQQVGLSK